VPTRTQIPRAIRDQVLGEYNHLCAVCGKPNPQLHHIDGDNANHEALNLLPLCANHHLTDQHNPTRKMETGRVALFRRFKDPAILSPRFEPLYCRLGFLDQLDPKATELESLENSACELIDFVSALHMGEFYSQRLRDLLGPIDHVTFVTSSTTDVEIDQWHSEHHVEYIEKLAAGRDEALRLCTELLRYQEWTARGI